MYKEFRLYDGTKTVGMIIGTTLCFIGASFYLQRRERIYACKEAGEDGIISRASYGTLDNQQTNDATENEKMSCKTC